MSEKKSMSRAKLIFEVQDALGFIALLQDGRAAKLLSPLGFSQSQFTVLFLLAQQPVRSWSVSELAEHMEMQLPGISKIVSQLQAKRLLKVKLDASDKRKKRLQITALGEKKNAAMLEQLQPNSAQTFSDWNPTQLRDFLEHLTRLKQWLEEHRDPS